MMTNRIRWARRQWDVSGRVNQVPVFTISWGSTSVPGKPYALHATLPGFSKTFHADESEAQQFAETKLTLFVESIGATWNEGP